ncbi:hypothetical protein ACP70R_023711 [Stipagrostis hirtigluma subsp. patula]
MEALAMGHRRRAARCPRRRPGMSPTGAGQPSELAGGARRRGRVRDMEIEEGERYGYGGAHGGGVAGGEESLAAAGVGSGGGGEVRRSRMWRRGGARGPDGGAVKLALALIMARRLRLQLLGCVVVELAAGDVGLRAAGSLGRRRRGGRGGGSRGRNGGGRRGERRKRVGREFVVRIDFPKLKTQHGIGMVQQEPSASA